MPMGVIVPQGVASLNSRDLIGRIYVVKHYMLLHTKNMVSEKIFKASPKISLWKLLIHRMWPIFFYPKALIDRIAEGPLDITIY